jgi:cytidylate kinase
MSKIRIAIDGPGGAGKSTIAKMIAKELNIDYVDTGAMYRAVAYKMLEVGIELENEAGIETMLADTSIDFAGGNILLDGKIINDFIRTSEISKLASDCSALGAVREKLVALQREMGRKKSVVMDGRDIATNVLKDAEFEFYMTASKEERARRRYDEFVEKGKEIPYEQVLADIELRDHNDMTRKLNPLRKDDDAIELDTTKMTIQEVCDYIISEIESKKN